jgi:long-subunit fatty acid transport protein
MTLRLFAGFLSVGALLTPAFASANPEPTAYDTRSISMGLTGTTFVERASALVLNPANMEGIDKLGFTLNFTGIFTNQIAPIQGPNTEGRSGTGFGPIPSGFIAGRIAPRVVFAAGLVIETGYGSSFDNVICLDGAPVTPDPTQGNNPPHVPSTNPNTCTNGLAPPDGIGTGPQDLDVTFFVGEASVGTSFKIHEKFWLGLALRLPFSKQVADLYQNVGAALGTSSYGRVKNDLSGVGFPSPRLGITIKPHEKVTIGIMYRMWSRIRLTGTTETSILTNPDGSPLQLNSVADWNIPHALQFGLSFQANPYLLNAFELRLQFHGADNQGNLNQTVTTGALPPTVVGFGWETVWSAKYGVEYRFRRAEVVAWRGGLNVARSAATEPWAQYFTPPPGISVTGMTGLGFYWDDRNDPNVKDKYMLDIGTLISYSGTTIGSEYIGTEQPIPGAPPDASGDLQTEILCSSDQVVRTGCPGKIGVWTWWASVSFTLQY